MGLRFPNVGTTPVSERSSYAFASKPVCSPDSASMPCTSSVRAEMSSSRAMACSVEMTGDQCATVMVQSLGLSVKFWSMECNFSLDAVDVSL